MRVQKPREIAARVLQHREKAADYVEDLLEAPLSALSGADRGLCQELVYGVVRWQRTLDWLIARRTGGRTQKTTLQVLLRLGLYQMLWLDRIPGHAAVNETVELARQLGCGPQSGFVNALLRGYARERDQARKELDDLKTTQPPLGHSHPDWLCERWQQRWGADKLRQLLEWNNTPPNIFARINTLRTDAGRLVELWRSEGVNYNLFRRNWLEENVVFELKSHPSLASLPSFQQGLFYVQDPGTLLAVRELDPRPGETILDFCAAPGGKTTYIAQLMQNRGRLVARDTNPFRLQRLRENCERLGVSGVETSVAGGDEVDAWRRFLSRYDQQGAIPNRAGSESRAPVQAEERFDRVLVDAPCSNTGVMRRRVDLRWRIRPEEIDRLRQVQHELLEDASVQTKPGGVLVYSTCSLEPEENGHVVKEYLANHPDFKLETERELFPFTDGVDGAYVARFIKR